MAKATDDRRGREARDPLACERRLWRGGINRVAGVDEAGVGPLAGPVVAAAVVFPPEARLDGVDDSKRLARGRRDALAVRIREEAWSWAVAVVDADEIDRLNILRARHEAMRRALRSLAVPADHALVDGLPVPDLGVPHDAIVGGDGISQAVGAASILAKTARDALMADYDLAYPGYGFASHKGYPTASHRDAIRRLGPCPIHRRSFTLLPPATLFDTT